MSEPTREQIKEAFKETIERWERIVEDVGYHDKSHCFLCTLFPGYIASCNPSVCPVALYAKDSVCDGTPYPEFRDNKTPANALAELNFLRKVYIWWMEKEVNNILEKYGIDDLKEEKKEEWEDVTEEIEWRLEDCGSGFHYLGGYYKEERVVNADLSGIWIAMFPSDQDFKVEADLPKELNNFRILKKI